MSIEDSLVDETGSSSSTTNNDPKFEGGNVEHVENNPLDGKEVDKNLHGFQQKANDKALEKGLDPFKKDDKGYLFGKYKDETEFAKAFQTLESENGRLRREKSPEAPEKYEYDFSKVDDLKTMTNEDLDTKLVGKAEEVFKKYKISNEGAQELVNLFVRNQIANLPNKDAELKKFGDQKQEYVGKISKLYNTMKDDLSQPERETFLSMAAEAENVKLLVKIAGMAGEMLQPDADGANTETTLAGYDSLNAAQAALMEFDKANPKIGGDMKKQEERQKIVRAVSSWRDKNKADNKTTWFKK